MKKSNKLLLWKPYITNDKLYFGKGASKPKTSNGKIYFGRKLRKRESKKRKQRGGRLANLVAGFANKLVDPLLKILAWGEKKIM